MRLGIHCFEDVEICSIVASINLVGTCDLTGKNNCLVYDTENVVEGFDLSAYFSEILDVYSPFSLLPSDFPIENLDVIENIIHKDWSIFSQKINPIEIKQALQNICKEIYSSDSKIYKEKVGLEKLCDSDFLRRNCLTKESSWAKFTSSIKSINRFHSNHINLELLQELFKSPSMQQTIMKGQTSFFRGRISDENILRIDEMGPPPPGKVTAGRANSQGIRCLYLASDCMTTVHEIRARDFDYITVGQFEAVSNLNIVDLAHIDKISPFSQGEFDAEWFAINMPILKKIGKEIAKPLRRQDSDLDYLPSQYIADYVKSLGYDGICYRSTLYSEGLNYAIFDPKKFKCINVRLIRVENLQYEITELQ